MMNRSLVGRFQIKNQIGWGSFGTTFKGYDLKTKTYVAIKFEKPGEISQLQQEAKAYHRFSGGGNIPAYIHFGMDGNRAFLVTELGGKDLDQLVTENGHLSVKTVLILADQMLAAIEFIHQKGYIHRDIKPENFVLGPDNSSKVLMIDFGLSIPYRDFETNQHIKFSENNKLTGTARYASINSLRGVEQSRRDDLESLAYSLIYMLKGTLPWTNMSKKSKTLEDRYAEICAIKARTSPEVLCSGLPAEFAWFLSSVRKLKFAETPKYAEYRSAFHDLFVRSGFADSDLELTQCVPKRMRVNENILQQTAIKTRRIIARKRL